MLAHWLAPAQLLSDLFELPPDAEDKPNGLLCLFLQLNDLEKILVLEFSEIFEGQTATALDSVSPAGAYVLPALLVVEDEV